MCLDQVVKQVAPTIFCFYPAYQRNLGKITIKSDWEKCCEIIEI